MLVLGRRENESIVIEDSGGETIVITVTHIRGNIVRLGFQASQEIKIFRKEVYNGIERE